MRALRPPVLLAALLLATSVAPSAQAGDPIPLAASVWRGTAQGGAKGVPGAPPPRTLTFTLAFGPLADPPLSGSQFRLLLTDGGAELPIAGTYSIDARGRPLLAPDLAALGAALSTAIGESCGALDDPTGCSLVGALEATAGTPKLKLKASAKDGVETLATSGKFSFDLAEPGGDPVARLSLSFKGNRDAARQ
jgi:hypothetical protein